MNDEYTLAEAKDLIAPSNVMRHRTGSMILGAAKVLLAELTRMEAEQAASTPKELKDAHDLLSVLKDDGFVKQLAVDGITIIDTFESVLGEMAALDAWVWATADRTKEPASIAKRAIARHKARTAS